MAAGAHGVKIEWVSEPRQRIRGECSLVPALGIARKLPWMPRLDLFLGNNKDLPSDGEMRLMQPRKPCCAMLRPDRSSNQVYHVHVT